MPPTSKSSFSVFTRLSRSAQRYTGEPDWVFPSPNICVNSWEDEYGWNRNWRKGALSILPCRSIINKLCHPKSSRRNGINSRFVLSHHRTYGSRIRRFLNIQLLPLCNNPLRKRIRPYANAGLKNRGCRHLCPQPLKPQP